MISIQVCLFSHLYLNHNEVVFFFLFLSLSSDGSLLLGASSLSGRSWQGSLWIYSDPTQAPAEGSCKAGVQTEAGVTDVSWVKENGFLVASDSGKTFLFCVSSSHLWELQLEVHLFDRAGALELWELSDKEGLLLNRFTKHEHNDIVTSVSPVTGGSNAVTGSMDCRSDSDSLRLWKRKCFTSSLQCISVKVTWCFNNTHYVFI